MSEPRTLRCYEYITSPYDDVRAALVEDTRGVFERATYAANGRARMLVSTLHARIAGLEIGKDVIIEVEGLAEEPRAAGVSGPRMRVLLTWRAKEARDWFPVMSAEVAIFPLSSHETQLELIGHYAPPMGVVGQALDALVGHRIAEATAHRFIEDVAMALRREAPTKHAARA
jgi:hypothetical protein